ncbi:MAG TPA: hypothetical protein VMG12_25625 [Polyangiaceae bacterium]|nr:hypothetical protein [Polyangiaceae bacterium]
MLALMCAIRTAAAQDVRVDRVAYCRTIWPICNDRTAPDYHWWPDYGVADGKQKETFIARYSDPSRANVQHLAFISAGQRPPFNNGDPSMLTGAVSGYVFDGQTDSATFSPAPDNFPQRLLNSGEFPPDATFMAAAWDARFNWGFTPDNKRELVDAYYAWLKSKFYRASLRSIYLAGHSRGGALVFALASRFNQDFPEIPLIVHIFDGVANASQQELGTGNGLVSNPISSDPFFFSDIVDFGSSFPNGNVRILNQVAGSPVLDFEVSPALVRSFAANAGSFDAGWMRQVWRTTAHGAFANSSNALDVAFADLMSYHPSMVAARAAALPPTARCAAHVDYMEPGDSYVSATFDGSGSTSNSQAPLTSWDWEFTSDTTGDSLGTASGSEPQQIALHASNICWFEGFAGRLTVTDANGNSAQTVCTVYYPGCSGLEQNPLYACSACW